MQDYTEKCDIILVGGQTHRNLAHVSYANQALAGHLARSGYKPFVLEHFWFGVVLRPEKMLKAILRHTDENTLALGISTTLLQIAYQNDEAKWVKRWWGVLKKQHLQDFLAEVKKHRPNMKIILGGAQVSDITRTVHLKDVADYGVIGQGENSLVAILDHLKFGTSLKTSDREGVTFVRDDDYPYEGLGEMSLSPVKGVQLIYPKHSYPLELARGCIFKCAYCNYKLSGKSFNEFARSAKSIADDLKRNYEEFGIQSYSCVDDTIIDGKEKIHLVEEVFSKLNFPIFWGGYLRLDLFYNRPEWIKLLRDVGFSGAFFGIETLHKEAGAKVGKGLGKERILETLTAFREIHPTMHSKAGIIFGLPGEPMDSLLATHEWCKTTNLLDSFSYYGLQAPEYFDSKITNDPEKYSLTNENGNLFWTGNGIQSYAELETFVGRLKIDLHVTKPTYRERSNWFAMSSHVNPIIRGGLANTVSEALDYIKTVWYPQRWTDVSENAIFPLTKQIRGHYYNDIIKFTPDYSEITPRARPQTIIPIKVAS